MSCPVFVVIPVFNEGGVIEEVIEEVQASGEYGIVVVDDGSADDTSAKASGCPGVIVLRHRINRGKGAAIKTGVIAAIRLGAEIIITMDGDGQHDPADMARMVTAITEEGYQVVLGTRPRIMGEMPMLKILANKIGNSITWLLYGMHVSDSQSGFRAYSRQAASIIDTKADKYEYDSKVIREINNNRLSFTEIEISVRYTDYSINKPQKQGFVNGIKTLVRMVWGFFV